VNRVNNLLMKYEHEQQRLVVSYNGARSTNLGVWDLGTERMVREVGGAVTDKLKADLVGPNIDFWVTSLDAHRCGTSCDSHFSKLILKSNVKDLKV